MTSLPAYTIAPALDAALSDVTTVVVTAPPGAGKSTVLPLTMLQSHDRGEWGSRDAAKIIVVEPRRLAARAVAERLAWSLDEPVGKRVGYRVRHESRVSAATRIEVVTEGILIRLLTDDPTLDGVCAVVFDEFHERSLQSDLGLAMVRAAMSLLRPDLRLVVMSATLDADALCRSLGQGEIPAPCIRAEGRQFPVTLHYSEDTVFPSDCAVRVAEAIRTVCAEHDGDLLAFLPGEGEIRTVAEKLAGWAERQGIDVLPLYGMMPLEEQRRVITPRRINQPPLSPSPHSAPSPSSLQSAPSPVGEGGGRGLSGAGERGAIPRRVILATPVAETSLTIDGITLVVDSGLFRSASYDPATGLNCMTTVPISHDMATQRAGRAGRTAPGHCYRLWSLGADHRRQPHRIPEIMQADLASAVLSLAVWGGTPADVPWITPPSPAAIAEAESLLRSLHAIDHRGRVTEHGRRMDRMGTHPRLAQMLLAAETPDEKALAANLAALLEERDPMAGAAAQGAIGADITLRLQSSIKGGDSVRSAAYRRIATSARVYRQLLHIPDTLTAPRQSALHSETSPRSASACGDALLAKKSPSSLQSALHSETSPKSPVGEGGGRGWGAGEGGGRGLSGAALDPWTIGRLVSRAFPERIARAASHGEGHYITAQGHPLQLPPGDALAASEWIAVAQAGGKKGVGGEAGRIWLAAPVSEDDLLDIATARRHVAWDYAAERIVAERQWRIGGLTLRARHLDDVSPNEILEALLGAIERRGESYLSFADDAVVRLQQRVAFVARRHPEMDLPSLAVHDVLPRIREWLAPFLSGITTAAALRRLDLARCLMTLLDYGQQQTVERLAPTHVTVPTGSRIAIDYREGASAPVLRVRLQECFGMIATPTVDDGRQPLLIELLSPGYKAVQLTQDLPSFWRDAYFAVRAELRRRYPKHAWPDNPLEAEPVRGAMRGKR